MPTATDVSIELATITAWLRAWEGSDEEARAAARTECVQVIMQVWHWLFGHGSVPPAHKPTAQELEKEMQMLRKSLGMWETHPRDQEAIKVMARTTLAKAMAFFTA